MNEVSKIRFSMKLITSISFALLMLLASLAVASSVQELDSPEQVAEDDVWGGDPATLDGDDLDSAAYLDELESEYEQTGTAQSWDNVQSDVASTDKQDELTLSETSDATSPIKTDLPGEDINFRLKTHTSTHHLLEGRAEADTGKILFQSRLMPSNEVKFSLSLKQSEVEDIEMDAYFDLAHYTMELDGKNAVLNADHKELMSITSVHIQSALAEQFQDYGLPEHGFMLIQMLTYWSKAPEGYVFEKRVIDSSLE